MINLICFKVLNNLASAYLVELLYVYETARCLHSSSDKWRFVIEPYNLKSYSLRALSVVAPLLLNSLPTDIRLIDNVSKFNSKLKTYLLKQVYALSYDFIFYHFFFVSLCFCYNVKIKRKLV